VVQVEGIEDVHELHVWQLTESRIIATIHIRCRSPSDYITIAARVKKFFHEEGIHSTTVQPEFAEMVSSHALLIIVNLNKRHHLTIPSSVA